MHSPSSSGSAFLHAPARDSLRVHGRAVGRFTLADGRPGDKDWQAAEMVAHFEPETVPILTRHGGIPVGYLDELTAEGPDLRMAGTVTSDDPEIVAVLQRGVAISIEPCEGGYPLIPGLPNPYAGIPPLSVSHPHYRGRLRSGMNLIGVALLWRGEKPAAKDSWMMAIDGE
jgi:hypothetical protein